MDLAGATRYDFRFARAYRLPALAFGVTGTTARVDLGPHGLLVRFGPWRLRTSLANVVGTERVSDFRYLKTAGPPHLSFADRGVTFATNGDDGVCLRFETPVAGIDPTRLIRHPGATLTLRDPDRFLVDLGELRARSAT